MQEFVADRREENQGDHVSLSDFLQEVALLTDLDSDADADTPKVSLMTIHAAKGLEFNTVFVVGLEENIFPSPMSVGSKRALEEERRLLYVAITRAEKHCILTCAESRYRYGQMEIDSPSRFIHDIDPRLLNVNDQWGTQNPRPVATQFRADPMPRAVPPRKEEKPFDPFSSDFRKLLNAASEKRLRPLSAIERHRPYAASQPAKPDATQTPAVGGVTLHEGTVIEHQRFGMGTVLSLEGTGDNLKATVEFRNAGRKQLLMKYANFKVIS
jgi:DNA helicase-2/ATP-dependent DNA helicase PcrA